MKTFEGLFQGLELTKKAGRDMVDHLIKELIAGGAVAPEQNILDGAYKHAIKAAFILWQRIGVLKSKERLENLNEQNMVGVITNALLLIQSAYLEMPIDISVALVKDVIHRLSEIETLALLDEALKTKGV